MKHMHNRTDAAGLFRHAAWRKDSHVTDTTTRHTTRAGHPVRPPTRVAGGRSAWRSRRATSRPNDVNAPARRCECSQEHRHVGAYSPETEVSRCFRRRQEMDKMQV